MTFDDGPNPPYTEQVLALLNRYAVRATFFFIGRNIEMHRTTALAVVKAGHEIGNHSYAHHSLALAGPASVAREIHRTDDLIRELGYQGEIPFRAPFGEVSLLTYFTLWSLRRPHYLYSVPPDPPDYLRPDPMRIYRSVRERISPGAVVLLHDGEGIRVESVVALSLLLPELIRQGYRFSTVTELFRDRRTRAAKIGRGNLLD